MDSCSHKTCIEVKTPNCPRCKMFEHTYEELQQKFPQFEYQVVVFGVDSEAQDLATTYNIKSAPTFVVYSGNGDTEVIKQEELEQTLVKYAD